jgi:DivIVA domain-containing protein
MAAYDNRSLALDRSSKQRSRLGPVGKRLANALLGMETHDPRPAGWQLARRLRDERGSVGEEVLPRFPMARRGYDCAAVDAHVAELERELAGVEAELADLRARSASADEMATEIKRIGEQTSTVLIAVQEQREEILRAARTEADRCVADATAKASAATAEGEARLRELEAQTEATCRQRDRLLEDARTVSAALAALADSAHERIPAKP